MAKLLHVVSLDVPYPANYGGVIDIYYKLEALQKAGASIILHTFTQGRKPAEQLNKLCNKVYYYPRKKSLLEAFFSPKPYIVYSRRSNALLPNLLATNAPILFEGEHTTRLLHAPELKARKRIVRACNRESVYFAEMAQREHNLLKRGYYMREAKRLSIYEPLLAEADAVLAISEVERNDFSAILPPEKVHWVPAFHGHDKLNSTEGTGNFFLYHGNLAVQENHLAVQQLLQIAPALPKPLYIAGKSPSTSLIKLINSTPNTRLYINPSSIEMQMLLSEAHAHLLITQQATGVKLKLLNALYEGRFVITNKPMVVGTGLANLVTIGDNNNELLEACINISGQSFTREECHRRFMLLDSLYNDITNAEYILAMI